MPYQAPLCRAQLSTLGRQGPAAAIVYFLRLFRLGQKATRSSRAFDMASPPVRVARPIFGRAIAIQLHPVVIGVAKIDRLGYAMVCRPLEVYPGVQHTAQRSPQRRRGPETETPCGKARYGREVAASPRHFPMCSARYGDDSPPADRNAADCRSVAAPQIPTRRNRRQSRDPDQRPSDEHDPRGFRRQDSGHDNAFHA